MSNMSCWAEFFSCFRSRKGDRSRHSTRAKTLISPSAFPPHTSDASLPPLTGESNSPLLPLPQVPQQAHIVEKGIVYPPDDGGNPASVDYLSDENYAILMKKGQESLAAGTALYSENFVASWPKPNTKIRETSESSADRDISNDNTSLKPLPKIYTGAMSPIRIPCPSLGAPVVPGDLEPGRSFLSLFEEYKPSPVKYTASFGKSGTYREATLSLFTERRDVNRGKQQGVTKTMRSLKPRRLYAQEASPGLDDVKTYEKPSSDERLPSGDLFEGATKLSAASDPYNEKKIEDSSGNTIGISFRAEESSCPRQKFYTLPIDDTGSPKSTIKFDSSINFSHLRALVEPSESNLTSRESLLGHRLDSSSFHKENFHTPTEIGALEKSSNLLSSVRDHVPSQPTDNSSVYSSEHTPTPSSVRMDGFSGDASGLAFPSGAPDQKAPDQAQNSYQASDNGLRKNFSPGPIFYPPAGRTRPLDVGTIRSIYPDRFLHSLQKSRRVTDHEIFEKHLDGNGKAGESSKGMQVQPRSSSYGAVTTRVGDSSCRFGDAWHQEHCNKSGVDPLRIPSCRLNPEYFPGIEGPQDTSSSKDNSRTVLATPINQLTSTGRLRPSISLGDRLRGHGRCDRDVDPRRRASTNSLRNRATSNTENIDENSDARSKTLGRRLKMAQSLSRLKNKMHPLSGLKYEMNVKAPTSTTVYHLSSYKPGGDFKNKDKRRLTSESDSRNEMEEGMKCSEGTEEVSKGNLGRETDNRPTELASDGSDNKVPIIEPNPELALTGYESCVMLPFPLTSFETLAETRSQEELVGLFSSPGQSNGHKEN